MRPVSLFADPLNIIYGANLALPVILHPSITVHLLADSAAVARICTDLVPLIGAYVYVDSIE